MPATWRWPGAGSTLSSRRTRVNRRGVFRLRFLDFSTGEIKTTATLPEGTEPNAGMSVAPDGSALLYSRIENQGSDLMMIENFR